MPILAPVTLYIWNVPIDLHIDELRSQVLSAIAGSALLTGAHFSNDACILQRADKDAVCQFSAATDWLALYRKVVWLRNRPYRMQLVRNGGAMERKRERGWQGVVRVGRPTAAAVLAWA